MRRLALTLALVLSAVTADAQSVRPVPSWLRYIRPQFIPGSGASFAGGTLTINTTLPNGAEATPSLNFANSTTTGLYARAGTAITFSIGGTGTAEFSGGTLALIGTATLSWNNGGIGATTDTFLSRGGAAATVKLGVDVNGAPVAQSIIGHAGITGSNVIGSNVSIGSGIGTGNAAGAQTSLARTIMGATGTTPQTRAEGVTVCESKTLSNTTATTTALATIALASNSSGAVNITVSVQCNDGTNFDSDIVTAYVAYVNKASAITFGTPVLTASAAVNNSGSCTIAPTFTSGSSLININVTPVITTIAPTTTTAFVKVENLGPGAVICK